MKKSTLWQLLAPLIILPSLTACNGTPVNNSGNTASAASGASDSISTDDSKPADETVTKKISQNLTARMQKAFKNKDISIQSVNTTPFKGIYEVVVTGNQILYTNEDGKYMLIGNLVDMENRRNITEERMSDLAKVEFDKLPLDKAIKEVRGNGSRILAVFSDPDCPFCKRLEHEIAKLDNITIYTFLMPIPNLHPEAQTKSVKIWCQKDRVTAWKNWMLKNKAPQNVPDCENPVEDIMKLGDKFGFNGTPTLVFPSGKTISGLMEKAVLEEELDKNQK